MAYNMGQAVGYLMLDTTGFTSGFKTAQRGVQQFLNQSNDAKTRIQGLGTAATATGKTMTKNFTLPLVGLGTAAVKVTADFDSQMSKVAAISGATGEEFDTLRDKAREMGEKTQFSATEAGEAFEYMAMAGWKTEDMLEGIEGIMNLAAASGEDLGTTSDIVTDALTAFGMSAEESAHFVDILAAASSNSNTNVAMMGETFKYAAPLCGTLGYSAEDAAVAIGLMANSGIKSSQAGTALRGILTRLAKPTDEVSTAMDALGISLSDDEGHMYSLRELMDNLREGFGQLQMPVEEFQTQMAELDAQFEAGEITETEYAEAQDALIERAYGAEAAVKAKYAAMLGGRNSLSGLLAIVNATTEEYENLTEAVDGCSDVFVKTADGSIMRMSEALEQGLEWVEEYNGESERMAATMRDNLSGQLTILKSQLQELAISIGDMIMPYLRTFVEWLQKLVDKLNNMDEETKERIVRIAAIVTALGPVLLILGKLFTVIGTIISVIKTLKTVFVALNAVMLANPITIVIAAIAALVAAFIYLWNHCESFREFWINLWEKIKETVSIVVDRIKYDWELLKVAIDILKEWFKQKIDDIKEFFDTLKDKIYEIVDRIKSGFEQIKSNVKAAWENIKSILNDAISYMKTAGSDLLSNFWNGLKEKWSEISSWVTEKVNWIKDKFSSATSKVKNWISGSYATGIDYILSDRVVQVHEGERILTKQENQRYSQNNEQDGQPIQATIVVQSILDGKIVAENTTKWQRRQARATG